MLGVGGPDESRWDIPSFSTEFEGTKGEWKEEEGGREREEGDKG